METADVVIIGGGVIGASIAYHLTTKGVTDVVVLERDTLGSGSTSRNAGGVRLQFSTEVNVRLSQRSLPRLERFEQELGVDPEFKQVGYLFLVTTDRDASAFERSLALWSRLDVPARRLDAAEVHELFPEIRVDDVRFATYCAKDGHLDPTSLLNGYVARARDAGVRFREGAAATSIDRANGRVSGVRTASEQIATRTVVNAAGPWAAQVGGMVEVELPITPLRRQIFVTDPVDGLDRDFPLTVEMATGFYFHRESGGVLMGMADPADKAGLDDSVNWDFLPTIVERALDRMPALEKANVKTGWAGFYEDTPDKHPILGHVAAVPGFLCAAGFSGHGLMHAPAAGEAIAELIVDGKSSLDISALSFDRFARGDLIREHNVI
ncbi:MAG TPA: FAD-binding oxidoreductase [Candidatus Limnocylindrales bacterium]|nr:FAD-binding oxidoreductase [Candidatus Limnocylindrales bacterium]